jgi:hypothetical protein
MSKHSSSTPAMSLGLLGETWFEPIEIAVRDQMRGFIETLVDGEQDQALGRPRYQRPTPAKAPNRHRRSGTAMVGGSASCWAHLGR